MAILTTCCCCSIRRGSFASGVYILVLHALVLSVGVLSIDEIIETRVYLWITVATLGFSLLCVVSSVLLLVGLCVDNPMLIVPWLVVVSFSTAFESIVAGFVVLKMVKLKDEEITYLSILFVLDIFICCINLYCILCVLSQYQLYKEEQRSGNRSNVLLEETYKFQASQLRVIADSIISGPLPLPRTAEETKPRYLTPDYCPNKRDLAKKRPSDDVDSVSVSEEKTEIQFNVESDNNSTHAPLTNSHSPSICESMTRDKVKRVTFGGYVEQSTIQSPILLKVPKLKKVKI